MTKVEYRDVGLNLDLYSNILTKEHAKALYEQLERDVQWSREITPGRRVNQTFGDEGLVYEIHWYGKTTQRKAQPWLPCLIPVRDVLEKLTNQKYNICVVQRYPSGKVGINPHRDREMKAGTTICGISLHQSRTLAMLRGNKTVNVPLESGSLYIFYPPTNDYWAHSIPKDDTKEPRISLTFRNY